MTTSPRLVYTPSPAATLRRPQRRGGLMSCVVHKHVIAIEDTPTAVLLPLDSKVVHVAMQNGAMCLWEEHAEPPGRSLERQYAVHGTGHAIPEGRSYVGTVLDPPFVWHVYELSLGGAA